MKQQEVIWGVTTSHAARHFIPGQLRALNSHGISAALFCPPSDEARIVCEGEGAEYVPIGIDRNPSIRRDFVSLWSAIKHLRRRRPVATVMGTPKMALIGGFAALVTRVPNRVYVVHGLRSDGMRGVKRVAMQGVELFTVRCATEVIAVSHSLAETIKSNTPAHVEVRVIGDGSPNGIDTANFRPPTSQEKLAARDVLGLEADRRVICFVARLTFDKGLNDLAAIVKQYESIGCAPAFVIAGVDETDYRCTEASEYLRSRPNVQFMGEIIDVRSIYWASDAIVHPSFREGCGLVLIEAIASGIPAVARNIAGCRDVVRSEADGLLMDNSSAEAWVSALDRVLAPQSQNPQLRHAASVAMQRRFSRDTVTRLWSDFLASLVSGTSVSVKKSATLTVFSEARLASANGAEPKCNSRNMSARRWTRDLDGIDGIRLAARVSRGLEWQDCHFDIDPGNLAEIPYYRGFRELLCRLPSVIYSVGIAVWKSDAIVIQVPSSVGLLASVVNIFLRRPSAIDVMGDVRGVVETGAIGNRTQLSSKIAFHWTRAVVRSGSVVRYMTQEVLQDSYPSKSSAKSCACSSVELGFQWFDCQWHGLNQDESQQIRVVAVGSQDQLYKGHDTLIRAAAEAKGGTEWLVTLIGDGRYQSALKELSVSLGVSENVRFIGYVGDEGDLREILLKNHVFAMPSVTEGLPRALIEAMALGMPCVGSRVGGIPELLDDDQLVAPRDSSELRSAVELLYSNPVLALELSRRNREVAGNYTSEALASARIEWKKMVGGLTL